MGSQLVVSQSVELAWDPSPADDVVAYTVYYGTESGFYTNSITLLDVTDVIIPGLENGETYYFAVSATDAYGDESAFSNEASYTLPGSVPPVPIVLQANADLAAQGVELDWNASSADNVLGYNVYYGTESGIYTDVTTVSNVTDTVIPSLEPGETYYFLVTAVDTNGVEDDFSTEASFLVPIPIVLQTQTIAGSNGQPGSIRINTTAVVSGFWELDCSTDLQSWTAYAWGYGTGSSDGYDVDVYAPVDAGEPQMFFRVTNY